MYVMTVVKYVVQMYGLLFSIDFMAIYQIYQTYSDWHTWANHVDLGPVVQN